jgi:hypothetical protein
LDFRGHSGTMDRHSDCSAAEVPAVVRAFSDWRREPHTFVDTVFCEIYHSVEFLFDMNVPISYNTFRIVLHGGAWRGFLSRIARLSPQMAGTDSAREGKTGAVTVM